MARTIKVINDDMIARVAADATLGAQLNSTSTTAIWRLWCYIIAVCIWALENLHDIFKQDVNDKISLMKPHSLLWYAEKAKAFQYGYSLVSESDYYDNTGLSEATILASKIVSYAAVVEQIRGVRIKVAKTSGSDLTFLTGGELSSFSDYMKRVKDAGVKLSITSTAADNLRVVLRVKYNALVLNSTGGRIDGATITPIKDAIKNHLKNLPFNGIFSVQSFVDVIQAVEGVEDLSADEVQTKYGALPFTSVNIDVVPDSGYLIIDDIDLLITYTAA